MYVCFTDNSAYSRVGRLFDWLDIKDGYIASETPERFLKLIQTLTLYGCKVEILLKNATYRVCVRKIDEY
jgi:hypothetical protein